MSSIHIPQYYFYYFEWFLWSDSFWCLLSAVHCWIRYERSLRIKSFHIKIVEFLLPTLYSLPSFYVLCTMPWYNGCTLFGYESSSFTVLLIFYIFVEEIHGSSSGFLDFRLLFQIGIVLNAKLMKTKQKHLMRIDENMSKTNQAITHI